MNLERGIERLERAAGAPNTVYVVTVPLLFDATAAEKEEAIRQALERNPAPKGTKVTVCVLEWF